MSRQQVLPGVTQDSALTRAPRMQPRKVRPMDERKYWDARLHEMLRWRRPHDSSSEIEWTKRFIVEPYKSFPIEDARGEVLAHVVIVNNGDSPPTTLFSSHVDTVHRDEGRQKITFNMATNHYGKNDNEPLGADCAAGVWLMLEMIDRAVPGAYFFHRGEERGGVGSDGIATHYAKVLERFDRAVAFDRKDTWSVITHQWGGRCCSSEFGEALAAALNEQNADFMYVTDDTGLFTDTANYVDVIPECTNVSVGYYDEHTPRERLDLAHLFALRDALVGIKWEELPVKRDPSVRDPDDFPSINFRVDSAGSSSWAWGQYDKAADLHSYDLYNMTRSEMENLCYDDPELFIDLVRYEIRNEIPKWAEGKE